MAIAPALLRLAPAPLVGELTRAWAPPRDSRVLVAVSGGADSVALLHLLAALARGRVWTILAASLDHGLRGPAGAADLQFVAGLADALGVPLVSGRVEIAPRPGESPEAAARAARHAFLEHAAASNGAAAIALAHTLDDQAETVLHRLGRGAGLLGAGAMRRWAAPRWRPMLGIRRATLRELLVRGGLEWCEDETNISPALTRNRIRMNVLPAFEAALGPGAVPALARAARLAADDEDFLAGQAANCSPEVVTREERGLIELDRRALADLPAAISRRILRTSCEKLVGGGPALGAAHVLALEALARAESPGTRADLPRGITAHRRGRVLILQVNPPEAGSR